MIHFQKSLKKWYELHLPHLQDFRISSWSLLWWFLKKHLRMSSVEQNLQLWTWTLFLSILKNVFKCLFYHKDNTYNLCRGISSWTLLWWFLTKHLRMSSVEQNIQLWTCTLFLCILKNVFKCLFYHKGYIYNLCRGKWCSWVKWHNQNFYMEMKKTSKQSQGKETDQLYLLLHCKCQSQVSHIPFSCFYCYLISLYLYHLCYFWRELFYLQVGFF